MFNAYHIPRVESSEKVNKKSGSSKRRQQPKHRPTQGQTPAAGLDQLPIELRYLLLFYFSIEQLLDLRLVNKQFNVDVWDYLLNLKEPKIGKALKYGIKNLANDNPFKINNSSFFSSMKNKLNFTLNRPSQSSNYFERIPLEILGIILKYMDKKDKSTLRQANMALYVSVTSLCGSDDAKKQSIRISDGWQARTVIHSDFFCSVPDYFSGLKRPLYLNDDSNLEKHYKILANIYSTEKSLTFGQLTIFINLAEAVLSTSVNFKDSIAAEILLNFCSDFIRSLSNLSIDQRQFVNKKLYSYIEKSRLIDRMKTRKLNKHLAIIFQNSTEEYQAISQAILSGKEADLLNWAICSAEHDFLGYFLEQINNLPNGKSKTEWQSKVLQSCITLGTPETLQYCFAKFGIQHDEIKKWLDLLAPDIKKIIKNLTAVSVNFDEYHASTNSRFLITRLIETQSRERQLAMLRCLFINGAFSFGKIDYKGMHVKDLVNYFLPYIADALQNQAGLEILLEGVRQVAEQNQLSLAFQVELRELLKGEDKKCLKVKASYEKQLKEHKTNYDLACKLGRNAPENEKNTHSIKAGSHSIEVRRFEMYIKQVAITIKSLKYVMNFKFADTNTDTFTLQRLYRFGM